MEHSHVICLPTDCGCFYPIAESNNHDKDHRRCNNLHNILSVASWPAKPKIFVIYSFPEKQKQEQKLTDPLFFDLFPFPDRSPKCDPRCSLARLYRTGNFDISLSLITSWNWWGYVFHKTLASPRYQKGWPIGQSDHWLGERRKKYLADTRTAYSVSFCRNEDASHC